MEPFDESDLKDMWDSELDETQSPKTLDDSYVHDWFEDNKFKDCKVILNDKLMSDALLNGMPIKSEHSYSLSSEGDFLQQSTSICRKREDNKKELTSVVKISQELDTEHAKIELDSPTKSPYAIDINLASVELPLTNSHPQNNNCFNRLANLVKTYNLHALEYEADGYTDDNSNVLPAAELQKQKRQMMLQRLFANNNDTRDFMLENDWSVSTASEDNEESVSSEFSSDVEIEDVSLKAESITTPLSSYTVSPESHLQGMRIDEPHRKLPSIINEATLKSLEKKNICLQISTPTASKLHKSGVVSPNLSVSLNSRLSKGKDTILSKLHTKTPTKIVHDEFEHNLVTENFRTPTMSNTVQRKTHETYDTKLNTMIIGSKEEATKSIYNNVIPITIPTKLPAGNTNSSIRQPINTPLISSQPKGSTGVLVLTEEEKRTLIAEGYPVPQQLPLSKTEEKSLKKIRRKIKNKISAQESRRKKKEYMDQLERRVEILVNENSEYKKRIEVLEMANNNLLNELRKQQTA